MNPSISEPLWRQLTAELTSEMQTWRLEHPKATLREIEGELDTHLMRLRARLLEDLALNSQTTAWDQAPSLHQPLCPDCHLPLTQRGAKTRTLQTHGGQQLQLTRSYGVCSKCGAGLFPPR